MLRTIATALQKKQTQAGYMAAAGKVGSEEKWAQAVMEYIHEKRHTTDSKKRTKDVENEIQMSFAYDRYCVIAHRAFEERIQRSLNRMNEALESIPSQELLEEAALINSQQFPLNFRRPSLTPPIFGYDPGFGFDVPQLRTQVMEYPTTLRPTDVIEFSQDSQDFAFPFVESEDIRKVTNESLKAVEEEHGDVRESAPTTGIDGESWEAYMALNIKALHRQQLILDLSNDADFQSRYDSDSEFRDSELQRRGIRPLVIELVDPQRLRVERHYAQEPHYQPIRKE